MIITTLRIKFKEYCALLFVLLFICAIVSSPNACIDGAKSGLAVCAVSLVPSLFPFAVAVLFLININALKNSKYKYLFVFLLSLVGGYPIGAKLIGELCKNGTLESEKCKKLLPFCVNAGPAFIVLVVGKGILKSTSLGYILLISHLISEIICVLIFAPEILFTKQSRIKSEENRSVLDNLVLSVQGAAGAVFSLCAYVIFFAVINGYIQHFSGLFKPLSNLIYLTEITAAVMQTGNLYFISFLLGFAGISIWVQVYSVAGGIRPRYLHFAAVRTLHGALSAAVTILTVRILGVHTATLGNGGKYGAEIFCSNLTLSISLLIMALLLAISISGKKHSGNLLKDML